MAIRLLPTVLEEPTNQYVENFHLSELRMAVNNTVVSHNTESVSSYVKFRRGSGGNETAPLHHPPPPPNYGDTTAVKHRHDYTPPSLSRVHYPWILLVDAVHGRIHAERGNNWCTEGQRRKVIFFARPSTTLLPTPTRPTPPLTCGYRARAGGPTARSRVHRGRGWAGNRFVGRG